MKRNITGPMIFTSLSYIPKMLKLIGEINLILKIKLLK